MQIRINGEPFETAQHILQDILHEWGAQPPVTIAVNQSFVPRSQHDHYEVQPQDSIDVLTPIHGG